MNQNSRLYALKVKYPLYKHGETKPCRILTVGITVAITYTSRFLPISSTPF